MYSDFRLILASIEPSIHYKIYYYCFHSHFEFFWESYAGFLCKYNLVMDKK